MSGIRPYSDSPGGFRVKCLIVDETSMILFPHFLALASLVEASGEIMLAGDNRQLSPIVSHDWEREDRPPVVLYQPYYSAYSAPFYNYSYQPYNGGYSTRYYNQPYYSNYAMPYYTNYEAPYGVPFYGGY